MRRDPTPTTRERVIGGALFFLGMFIGVAMSVQFLLNNSTNVLVVTGIFFLAALGFVIAVTGLIVAVRPG